MDCLEGRCRGVVVEEWWLIASRREKEEDIGK